MSTAQLPAPNSVSVSTSRTATTSDWLPLVITAALVTLLFGSNILSLVGLWNRDANYSHGYLVAPISLLLGWRIFRRVGGPIAGEPAFGLMGIIVGLSCQFAAVVVVWPPLSYLGLVCVLRGLLVSAGGRAWAAAFNFPLLFLFFMFPLPVRWTGYASLWLQDVVSRMSETVIGLFVVCSRVGHSIQIAGVDRSLVVAEECSGLGQIVSFLAFAALLGHLLNRPRWHCLALLLGAVPIAIAANTLRVTMMNLGAAWFGTQWMGGTLHDVPALFSIPVGIAFFLLLDHVLAGLSPQQAPETPTSIAPPSSTPGAGGRAPTRGLVYCWVVLAAGIATQFALANHVRSAGELSYPQLNDRLSSLPLVISDSRGQPQWIGQDMPEALERTRTKLPYAVDDLLIRSYQGRGGVFSQLYLVHSRSGEDRKHHPEICIRDVSGAPEDIGFRKQIPLGDGFAQRFRFQTGSTRSVVVYYWHYTPSPVAVPGQTRLQTLHQRIGVAAPSVTAQLTLLTDNPAVLNTVETQLLPSLDAAARQQVLPPGTTTGCDRIPISLTRE